MKIVFQNIFFLLCFSLPLFGADQKLILLRHGEATNNINHTYNSFLANSEPATLTEEGRQTVAHTARGLMAQGYNNKNIVAVYVSPLPRAKQTAEALVQVGLITPKKIIVDERLIDRQAGELEGQPIRKDWTPLVAEQYHAESDEEVKTRTYEFYNYLLNTYPDGNIIVISHEIPLQKLIEHITNQKVQFALGEANVVPLRPHQ